MIVFKSIIFLCSFALINAISIPDKKCKKGLRFDGFPKENPQNWGYVGMVFYATYSNWITKLIHYYLFALEAAFDTDLDCHPKNQEYGQIIRLPDVRQGAHMFWWMHFTKAKVECHTERPLVIWLQGGPGIGSTGFGNVVMLGPIDLDGKERNISWIHTHNVLFVDNPVGAGFSYVDDDKYLATNNQQIAKDLVELLRGVYKVLPQFKKVPLHIFGQSYGGKMAIEFALELDAQIKAGLIEANPVSVSLGNAWTSPIDYVSSWAPFLKNLGLIDQKGYDTIDVHAKLAESSLNAGNNNCYEHYSNAISVTEDVTGNVNFYDVLKEVTYPLWQGDILPIISEDSPQTLESTEPDLSVLMNTNVRRVLKISENISHDAYYDKTHEALSGDFMVSVVNIVEKVLNSTNIRVNVYNGDLDLICCTLGTDKWVNRMNWYGKAQYNEARRYAITVRGILEGYLQRYDRFSMFWIHRAGHRVPLENPKATAVMMREITNFATLF